MNATRYNNTSAEYEKYRPPYYYTAARDLAPPPVPESFTPMHIEKSFLCEPHGEQLTLLGRGPESILINKMHDAVPLSKDEHPMTVEQIDRRLASFPTEPAEIKQMLTELANDYIATVFSGYQEIINNPCQPKETVQFEREQRELAEFINYLKLRQAKYLLRKELQGRIQQKRLMIETLKKISKNIEAGEEPLSGCVFPPSSARLCADFLKK